MQANFSTYFNGLSIFDEPIFKYTELSHGKFYKYAVSGAFCEDSINFKDSLSAFLRSYNEFGSFGIGYISQISNVLTVGNSFDFSELRNLFQNHDERMEFDARVFFDYDFMWCMFLDDDLDIFITWVSDEYVEIYNRKFPEETFDYKIIFEKAEFLERVLSMCSYRLDFDRKILTNALVSNNKIFFA